MIGAIMGLARAGTRSGRTSRMRKPAIFLTILLLAVAEVRAQPAPLPAPLTRFADSITELPSNPSILRGRVYVPAYSSLLIGSGNTKLNLSVTLSIHNTSERGTLVIERI